MKKNCQNSTCSLSPGDHYCGRLVFQLVVFRKLLFKNRLHKWSSTDRTPLSFVFCLGLTFTFQLVPKLCSQVSSMLPPDPRYVPSAFIAHRVHSGFPLLVDFHRILMLLRNSRSRALPESICAQEKVPYKFISYELLFFTLTHRYNVIRGHKKC